jgi:putative ABC transport system permease protein
VNAAAAVRSALEALRTNLMRSALTMLGIIIGVSAVITMLAVGRGAQERVEEQLESLGSNIMLVLPGVQTAAGVRLGGQSWLSLTEDDAAAISRDVPEVEGAAPTLRIGQQAIAGNANWATTIVGATPEFLEVRDWPLVDGRVFEPGEVTGAGKVAILGQTAAEQLFGDQDPIDQIVRVRKVPLTVIGVLDRKGQNSIGQDQDDVIVVPLTTYRNRIQGWSNVRTKRVSAINVKVREGASMAAAEVNIRDLLRQRHRLQPDQPDDFTIRNLTEMLRAQEESSRVMTWLLAAVAGVSLVVGGIGIMNIMLVSVTERTREIGLRLAVGARSRDILGQFLVEAVTLSIVGGLIGVALGSMATVLLAHFAGWNVVLGAQGVALAVLFAASIGVFFGWYPARRAAGLLPIQALRHE